MVSNKAVIKKAKFSDLVHADICIVGSGLAGALTAYKLAGKGKKVIILEAGSRIVKENVIKSFQSSHKHDFSSGYPNDVHAPRPDWSQESTKNHYIELTGPDKTHFEYLRVVGGTTWHWNANTNRLLPSDFTLKTSYGVGEDWPISYSALEPYYKIAEKELGISDLMPLSYAEKYVQERLQGTKFDIKERPVARSNKASDDRPACQGFGTCAPICPSGAQYSAIVHLQKAEKKGVLIYENSRAVRLVQNGKRITEVIAKTPENKEFRVKAHAFVLAANGIETPKLLLMSRSESHPFGIANTSGVVGKYFFDHPGLHCHLSLPDPVYPGRGPQSNAVCYFERDGAFRVKRPGWYFSIYTNVPLHEITLQLLQEEMRPPRLIEEIRRRASRHVSLISNMEQLPDRQNSIHLDFQKKDTAGDPCIKMFYKIGEYERRGFEKIKMNFQDIATHLNAQNVRITGPSSHHHMMGTTRMGHNSKNSVVNAHCQTHDYLNLFIAGSSTFVTGGSADPSLTIAALSLKLADFINKTIFKK